MKVIALERGFFGGAPREKGAVFEVPDGRRARWYAPVDEAAKAPKDKAEKPKKEAPATLSEMQKDVGESLTEHLA